MEGLIPWVLIMQLGGLAFVGQNEFTSLQDCENAAHTATSNLLAEYKCIPNYKRVKESDLPEGDKGALPLHPNDPETLKPRDPQ